MKYAVCMVYDGKLEVLKLFISYRQARMYFAQVQKSDEFQAFALVDIMFANENAAAEIWG